MISSEKGQQNSNKEKVAKNQQHPPKPERFLEYELLSDKMSFKIANCNHIFKLDQYGGWFDEYDNYYDCEGNPCTPPETEEENYDEDEDEDYAEDGDYYDENYDHNDLADKLINEYDSRSDDDDNHEDNFTHYEKNYYNDENTKRIKEAMPNVPITIKISNINYYTPEKTFLKFIADQSKVEIKDYYIPYLNYGKKHRGIIEITVYSQKDAYNLIKLNGKELDGRPLNVLVYEQEFDSDENDSEEYDENNEVKTVDKIENNTNNIQAKTEDKSNKQISKPIEENNNINKNNQVVNNKGLKDKADKKYVKKNDKKEHDHQYL